jgi:hypothetical protein
VHDADGHDLDGEADAGRAQDPGVAVGRVAGLVDDGARVVGG